MLKSTLLGLVFLVIASALEAGQATIDSFKAEVEASLNAQIEITESIAPGGDMGETYCQVRPVAIRLEANLPAELREAVLSHELGHAILCARGIYILDALTDDAKRNPHADLLGAFTGAMASCYIDPLADAEAEKRGFRPNLTVDEIARRTEMHTRHQISDAVKAGGELQVRFIAMALYCTELRPHSFRMQDLEQHLVVEPMIIETFHKYQRDLGSPTCSDWTSCFALTKRLRDELGLSQQIRIWDFDIHALE